MKHRKNRRRRWRCERPALRFTPYAWAKLIYLRDAGETEIGGFAISDPDDVLLVEDVVLVQQHTSAVSVVMVDRSVADYFDAQVDIGRTPQAFARIWVHTHPAHSAHPSPTDEETFDRVFGVCDWAVMFILARGGQTYCRARFRAGPGTDVRLPVTIEYSRDFPATRQDAWDIEYRSNVFPVPDLVKSPIAPAELWPEQPGDAQEHLDPWNTEWFESFGVDESDRVH